jgi:hypothetical protein
MNIEPKLALETLMATWYVGVLAIAGGMTVPLGPARIWVLRFGTAIMAAAAAVMAYEFVHLG